MLDTLDTQSLHYMPIGVSGQMFALPMSEVADIRRLEDEDMAVAASVTLNKGLATVPIIDLRRLFFPVSQPAPERPTYVVVIAIPGLTFAVLVDDVRPARRAAPSDHLTIPPLLAVRRYPFSGVIREAGSPVLMIDVCLLADELRQVRPDSVMELPHAP
jgi:chemotaxis signal transduction protein